jgi:hypothetical protein
MRDRTTIVIERETRELMKNVATKRQTYNDLIIELLNLRESYNPEKK